MLWPPNHRMKTVTIHVYAEDGVSNPTALTVTAEVRSDEPDDANGVGDGHTTGDVDGHDGFSNPVDVTSKLVFNPTLGTNGAWVATVDLRAAALRGPGPRTDGTTQSPSTASRRRETPPRLARRPWRDATPSR